MNIHVRYARVVTPHWTYVKHTIVVNDGVARVLNPRTNELRYQLHDATTTELGPGYYRIEGIDDDDDTAILTADNIGCGCRNQIRTYATDSADVPT